MNNILLITFSTTANDFRDFRFFSFFRFAHIHFQAPDHPSACECIIYIYIYIKLELHCIISCNTIHNKAILQST